MKVRTGAADLLASHGATTRPVTVSFQVTDRCNYDCVHCYQEHVAHDELSIDEVERVLREIADLGVLFLTLMGGEFFMHPHADRILATAHELGFAIKLKTTGHHITDKRADRLAQLRPIQVDLSMYAATAHLHDSVTTQHGSWEKTYAAAQRLVARKIPIQLNAPVMEETAGDLEKLRALARELGAKHTFDPKITGMENQDQSPTGLRLTGESLAEFYRGEQTGIADFLAESYQGFDPTTTDRRPLADAPCRAGKQTININPRGEVWPCNLLPIKCGDLRTQSLADVWRSSAELADLRDLRWADIAECNTCAVRSYCQRCNAMALLEQGELRGPSLEACRHAVAVRDSLRERGLIPESETGLPPTWERIHPDGRHASSNAGKGAIGEKAVRARRLRVI